MTDQVGLAESPIEDTHSTIRIPDVPWSQDARLASNFWFGMDATTRWSYISRYSITECAQLEFDFLRKHQEAHFVDGSAKLGLADFPDHVRCAMYHTLSNLLGGLDMGFRDDEGDGKAWVYYLPPQAYASGPLHPTSAHQAVPGELVLRTFEAWQSNNGVVLGNDRLFFTLTDCIQFGGAYDAGYFSEAAEPIGPDQRYVIDFEQRSPAPGPPPELSIGAWPIARREAALRKYSAEYALGGIAQIAAIKGFDAAIEIAEESYRNLLVAWIRFLTKHFDVDTALPPAQRLAVVFERIFGVLDDEFESVQDDQDWTLRHVRTRLSTPQYDGWEFPPRAVEEAWGRAWRVASRAVGPEIAVTVDQSRSEGAEATVWRFRVIGD